MASFTLVGVASIQAAARSAPSSPPTVGAPPTPGSAYDDARPREAKPEPDPAPRRANAIPGHDPGAAPPDPRREPATRSAQKVLALKEDVQASLIHTVYQHRTVIRPADGVYLWDCSGMVAWFLRKSAPVARRAMDKGRPVARDFYRHIARAPTTRPRKGWQRLSHIEDVRPGDMFAWIRPPGFPSRNTGHVGFALAPAEPVPEIPGAYTLRILDATSLPHQDDTRRREDGGGIGEGTIMFVTDDDGRGTAYGWFGRRSRGVIETDIVFGRVSR